jgi:integrase
MSHVRGPKVRSAPRTFTLEIEHAQAMCAAASAHSRRAGVLVLVLLVTGLRINELLSADVHNLSHEGGHRTLTVRRKGGWPDTVVLPPPVSTLVDEWVGDRRDGPLLTTRTGARWHRTAASRLLHTLADESLPRDVATRFRPHSLRVAMINFSLDLGASPVEAMISAGHSTLATTNRYIARRHALSRSSSHLVTAALVGRIVATPVGPLT